MIDREGLAQFLRHRREGLQPEDVGMPRGQRRRTRGLRREEVAVLCHMSTDYYSRLERASGPKPSEQMIASIAQGLHLSREEHDHLFHLAGHTPPPRGAIGGHVAPGMLRILDRLADTPAEIAALEDFCREHGVKALLCRHWAEGGAGAENLARAVVAMTEGPAHFTLLYPDEMPLWDKIQTICTRIYGAAGVEAAPGLRDKLERWQRDGHGNLPVCMAKTQYSFSADPTALGAPEGFTIPLREVRLAAGAGFIVAICGEIMTMPGLPREPAALRIGLDAQGQVQGLF